MNAHSDSAFVQKLQGTIPPCLKLLPAPHLLPQAGCPATPMSMTPAAGLPKSQPHPREALPSPTDEARGILRQVLSAEQHGEGQGVLRIRDPKISWEKRLSCQKFKDELPGKEKQDGISRSRGPEAGSYLMWAGSWWKMVLGGEARGRLGLSSLQGLGAPCPHTQQLGSFSLLPTYFLALPPPPPLQGGVGLDS